MPRRGPRGSRRVVSPKTQTDQASITTGKFVDRRFVGTFGVHPFMQFWLVTILLFVSSAASAWRPGVDHGVPATPDPQATYLIYLHGRIAEGASPRPRHPRFGKYDYPGIVEVMGSRGAVVLSQQRAANADVDAHADHVMGQVEMLMEGGVPAERIVVIGFSKGGAIALWVADRFDRPGIRYVILAACSPWLSGVPALRLSGNVLSIFEESDELAGSCVALNGREARAGTFDEIALNTGLAHGAFYLPSADWIAPMLDWIHGPEAPEASLDSH